MSKLCKDCRWYRAAPQGLDAHEYAKCMAPSPTPSLVTGATTRRQYLEYCAGCRGKTDSTLCGPEAQFFECGKLLDNENYCGDEGRLCDTCIEAQMREHAWMAGHPLSAITGVMSEAEKQDLRDAGRGHLLP